MSPPAPSSLNGQAGTGDTPIRVGILGLGRSGWNIHAKTLIKHPGRYQITAVSDPVAERRSEAEALFGCRSFREVDALIASDLTDLVVVASPNRVHVRHAVDAMRAGNDVVIEKPVAQSSEEALAAIDVAEQTGRLLAPFHNRRYEPHFQKVKQLIDDGVLGDVVLIRMHWHGFTRRWDWQTLREYGGGLLANNGSHLIDQALQLFGPGNPEVWVDLQKVLSSGDAEDHVKLILRGEGAPTIDIELTSACGFPQDRWLVMGSNGALRGNMERLEWRTVDWSTMPARPVDRSPTSDRSYNKDVIEWKTEVWDKPADALHEYDAFYNDLYATIRQGKPLFITPESVVTQLDVIERCRTSQPTLGV